MGVYKYQNRTCFSQYKYYLDILKSNTGKKIKSCILYYLGNILRYISIPIYILLILIFAIRFSE